MTLDGRVGPAVNADGALNEVRLGKDSSIVTQDSHARYQEAVIRGNVFNASQQAGGVNSTGTAVIINGLNLYNPVASGKNLVLLNLDTALGAIIVTGSTGAIFMVAGVGPNVAVPSGTTALTVYNNLLNPAVNSVAKAYSTATYVGAPVAVKTIGFTQSIGTLAADVAIGQIHYEIAGEFIVPPGAWIAVSATTALNLQSSITWEEVSV